jgi:hypothetical protein
MTLPLVLIKVTGRLNLPKAQLCYFDFEVG